MLLALWYYIPTTREEFIDLYELISDFELAYFVPQSDVPTSESYSEPLLVSDNDNVGYRYDVFVLKAQSILNLASIFSLLGI